MLARQETYEQQKTGFSLSRISDYAQFTKMRLSSLVVLSAAITYAHASSSVDWQKLLWLILGGFLITGSSNGFNQIIERDTDKLMRRTANRPLPAERMSVSEAGIIAFLMGIAGLYILWNFINPLSGLLGLLALGLYTVIYTPLKKLTPFAVFIGAFPGAIPPMLGWVAATGSFSVEAWIVFAIQFIWQFPHFWAIAWVIDEDYKRAGFKMLPSRGGRDKSSAFQVLVYSLSLIPISLLPVAFKMSGPVAGTIILFCGIFFALYAYRLFQSCSEKTASRLMFASFVYLPVVQIILLMDKL